MAWSKSVRRKSIKGARRGIGIYERRGRVHCASENVDELVKTTLARKHAQQKCFFTFGLFHLSSVAEF